MSEPIAGAEVLTGVHVGYYVAKTTTDKLAGLLNGFSADWTVHQITHIGGRDWVVIATNEFQSWESRSEWAESEDMA